MQIQFITTDTGLQATINEAVAIAFKTHLANSHQLSTTSELKAAPATRQDAASYLGVSLPTLDKLINSGQLNAFNIGRQVRIKWSEIEAYVNKNGAAKQ